MLTLCGMISGDVLLKKFQMSPCKKLYVPSIHATSQIDLFFGVVKNKKKRFELAIAGSG